MNLYFLVEGKTERKVYPRWIDYLMPHLTRISTPTEATQDNYFLISGGGYPHLLDKQLGDSVKDIQETGNYNHFIVVLDAEEFTVSKMNLII
jgi:hypothetical protein